MSANKNAGGSPGGPQSALPDERLTHVTMERRPNGQWSLVLREGVLGPTLFEAYNLASIDECLEQLAGWRKGMIVV